MLSLKMTVRQMPSVFFVHGCEFVTIKEFLTDDDASVQLQEVTRRQGGPFAQGFLANCHKKFTGFLLWEHDTNFRHEMF